MNMADCGGILGLSAIARVGLQSFIYPATTARPHFQLQAQQRLATAAAWPQTISWGEQKTGHNSSSSSSSSSSRHAAGKKKPRTRHARAAGSESAGRRSEFQRR